MECCQRIPISCRRNFHPNWPNFFEAFKFHVFHYISRIFIKRIKQSRLCPTDTGVEFKLCGYLRYKILFGSFLATISAS